MDPITLGAGAIVVGSLVQLYNSEKARGVEKARLEEIERMFDQVKPPDYDLSIQDPPALHKEVLESPKFAGAPNAPKFNLAGITPQQLKLVGTYNPQVGALIKEEQSSTIQNTGDMQTARQAQLNALKRYTQIGEGEFDPQYQEMVQNSSNRAQSEAQSRSQSTLQDAQRRGTGGSGVELAAKLSGSANAMNTSAQTNMSAATQAYLNRLNALSQGASIGGQINNQDVDLQNRNANIINSYNQRSQQNAQNYENNRAGTLNAAQLANLNAAQGLADSNVGINNQALYDDRNREDALAKYLYGTQMDQVNMANANAQNEYANRGAERDYQNQIATQLANWRVNQRDYQNNMKSQQYNNSLKQISGKTGIASMLNENTIGTAQDRNNVIQGAQNAAVNGAMAWHDYDMVKKDKGTGGSESNSTSGMNLAEEPTQQTASQTYPSRFNLQTQNRRRDDQYDYY